MFDRLGPAIEPEVSLLRRELLPDLRGRVLEVGAGNAHYPGSVTEVVALEPERYCAGGPNSPRPQRG
jgi:hypothetical protein